MVYFSPVTGDKTKRIVEGGSQGLLLEALGTEMLFGYHSNLGYYLDIKYSQDLLIRYAFIF